MPDPLTEGLISRQLLLEIGPCWCIWHCCLRCYLNQRFSAPWASNCATTLIMCYCLMTPTVVLCAQTGWWILLLPWIWHAFSTCLGIAIWHCWPPFFGMSHTFGDHPPWCFPCQISEISVSPYSSPPLSMLDSSLTESKSSISSEWSL